MASHKMDETKYEKVEGGFLGALELMKKGETVYDEHGRGYVLNDLNELHYINSEGDFMESNLRFNPLTQQDWYKNKTFDVRQAMRERPDEWVAAYKTKMETWVKLGFDTDSMNAVFTKIECDTPPFFQHIRVTPFMLQQSIPIEDVPEEAKG